MKRRASFLCVIPFFEIAKSGKNGCQKNNKTAADQVWRQSVQSENHGKQTGDNSGEGHRNGNNGGIQMLHYVGADNPADGVGKNCDQRNQQDQWEIPFELYGADRRAVELNASKRDSGGCAR